jgi:hypothetical protein
VDFVLDGFEEGEVHGQVDQRFDHGVYFVREQFVGYDFIGDVEISVVASADVMVPAVRLLPFGSFRHSHISFLGAVGVNFSSATFFCAVVVGVAFHANFADVGEFLIV